MKTKKVPPSVFPASPSHRKQPNGETFRQGLFAPGLSTVNAENVNRYQVVPEKPSGNTLRKV
jgi:hypothetical protein